MSKLASELARAAFVVALPILLFAGNLIWVVLDVGTYERLFFDYGAATRTGFSDAELSAVAQQFAVHFRDGTPVTVTVDRGGQQVAAFGERELVHLRDIHDLVRFGINALAAIGAVLVVSALAGIRLWRGRYAAALSGAVMGGGLLTLGALAALGFGVLVAFDRLFWIFHELSFPNDFWQLDPREHNLINLMAREFYIDTVVTVAMVTALEALALALVAGVIWWRSSRGPADRGQRAGANG